MCRVLFRRCLLQPRSRIPIRPWPPFLNLRFNKNLRKGHQLTQNLPYHPPNWRDGLVWVRFVNFPSICGINGLGLVSFHGLSIYPDKALYPSGRARRIDGRKSPKFRDTTHGCLCRFESHNRNPRWYGRAIGTD